MRALVTAQLTADARRELEHDLGWTLTVDRGALYGPAFGQPLPVGLDQFDAAIVEADPISAETLQALPVVTQDLLDLFLVPSVVLHGSRQIRQRQIGELSRPHALQIPPIAPGERDDVGDPDPRPRDRRGARPTG